MQIQEISENAQNIINRFLNLQIAGKTVITPYCMNLRGQRGGLRVMVGKGDPEEIEHEVLVWAQVKGFDIEKATPEQIREFMIDQGIGIDCSGFAVYVINAELASRGLKEVWNYLEFNNKGLIAKLRRFFRPVENIGAELITNENNCIKIDNLNEIRPSDLIRAKGKQKNAHHVGIVTKVEKNDEGVITAFEYANSHRHYEEFNGVRIGRVEITDPNGELKNQNWIDHHGERNYFYEDLMINYEDNGIRRLKVLAR